MTKTDAVDRWLDTAPLDVAALDTRDADVVVLGEMNHFVHEKSDFRLTLAPRLLALGHDVWGEELGWSDGTRIDAFMRSRDESVFDRIALFGYRGDARGDRDDTPTGIFRASFASYPHALMRAEQQRFYRGLRAHGYFGFDVAAGHDGAYADMRTFRSRVNAPSRDWWTRLEPVPGESINAEIARLQGLRRALPPTADPRLRAALSARIDGLGYTGLMRDASTYEATRPAMAVREDAMKRRFAEARELFAGHRMVLLGHAVHLAKDDTHVDTGAAVGAGGNRTPSLGAFITRELGLRSFVIWMLYGGGEDAQPLPDLPRVARYPDDTLNVRLAQRFDAPVLLSTANAPAAPLRIGHMYNTLLTATLPQQVDALWFVPTVTPMRLD